MTIVVGLIYFVIINIISMIFMSADKARAVKRKRRVPERTLFLVAILGGSLGTFISMRIWRHKTKHTSFVVGIPLIILVHIVIVVYLFNKFT